MTWALPFPLLLLLSQNFQHPPCNPISLPHINPPIPLPRLPKNLLLPPTPNINLSSILPTLLHRTPLFPF